jgi:putative acetyltransferase
MQIEIKEAYDYLDAVRELFGEYVSSLNIDLAFQSYEEEIASLPGKYSRPDGRLYLAYSDGLAAGCVGLRRFDRSRCEMKRLYVRSRFRGLKLGERLTEQVIRDAKAAGYAYMLLDTLPAMKSAQALYRKLGFEEIEPYYGTPIECTRFLCLHLKG